jgi:predicted DNA-binding transcriptional regulator AlpA
MNDPETSPLLRESQAAEFLLLSRSALAKWRVTGAGPRFVKVGPHSVRYRRVDLEAFITAGIRRSTSEASDAPA